MTELLTAAQMRAIEAAAIASGEVTGLDLMERAGCGVVAAIFEEWPELQTTSHRAVVLSGPGNNGGDGFVVARLLKEWRWEVEVFLYGEPEKLPPDARVNYERWVGMGEVRNLLAPDDCLSRAGSTAHVIVDAIFGIGLSRPLVDELRHAFVSVFSNDGYLLELEGIDRRSVAIDVPSGLCSDSGRILGSAFPADLIVAFHRAKIGHYLSEQFLSRGTHLRVVPIGLPERFAQHGWAIDGQMAGESRTTEVADLWPNRSRLRIDDIVNLANCAGVGKGTNGHKYTHGHALMLSGGQGKGGAARLAARGALRVGAGLVTVGCPPEALTENAARLDAVMLQPIADADALGRVLVDARINALCLGPGLGTSEREAGLVAAALGVGTVSPQPLSPPQLGEGRGAPRRAVVLDADALTLLAQNQELFAALHDRCVLTPHGGEFARLFPDIAEKLAAPATKGPAYSKVDACREAAARAGCVVVYKGPDTVIADPEGRCSINSAQYERAAPWLATAGSGDVLAGFVTGLLARGFPPMAAAETAAWLHVECARKFGPGLIAEDLPEQIPAVFHDLGL